MYKSNSLWDQEQDKYDIIGDDHNSPDYRNNEAYSSGGSPSDEYSSNKAGEDEKREKSEFEKKVDDNLPQKKYDKKDEEADVRAKAAKEIHQGIQQEKTKINKNSKSSKSIEDAIKKAVKEEQEVIRP